jgi:cytoskeletal protein CcmA (bactofilin family)
MVKKRCVSPTRPNEATAMKGMHRGDVIMDQDGRLSGMVAGDVIVRAGCDVRISGMVAGDVYVEEGARAWISGMVSGRIIGQGGDVRFSGMVGG